MIQNIDISNFKSIRHLKMEGCRRINVLIGPPNVGKSNILEALGLFHYTHNKSTSRLQDLVRNSEFRDLFFNWDVSKEISLSIDKTYFVFGTLGKQGTFEFEFYKNSQNAQIPGEKVSLDIAKSLSVEAGKSIDVLPSLEGEIENFPKIKFYKYKENIEYIKKNLVSLEPPFGENLMDTIVLNPMLRRSIAQLLKLYNLKLVVDLKDHGLTFSRFFDEETFLNVPYYLFADTLKRLIFFQAAVLSNKDAVLLFEEPEAHCYEPYILETTNAIKNDNNRNQFFIVTHSSFVVQELLRDQDIRNEVSVYLVDNNENLETVVKRLDDGHLYEIHTSGIDLFFNFKSLWNETEYV